MVQWHNTVKQRTVVVPMAQYRQFFTELSRSLGTKSLDELYARHAAYCEKCGAEFTRETLTQLYLFGPGSELNRNLQVIGGTAEGSQIRSGRCPYCGHSKLRVTIFASSAAAPSAGEPAPAPAEPVVVPTPATPAPAAPPDLETTRVSPAAPSPGLGTAQADSSQGEPFSFSLRLQAALANGLFIAVLLVLSLIAFALLTKDGGPLASDQWQLQIVADWGPTRRAVLVGGIISLVWSMLFRIWPWWVNFLASVTCLYLYDSFVTELGLNPFVTAVGSWVFVSLMMTVLSFFQQSSAPAPQEKTEPGLPPGTAAGQGAAVTLEESPAAGAAQVLVEAPTLAPARPAAPAPDEVQRPCPDPAAPLSDLFPPSAGPEQGPARASAPVSPPPPAPGSPPPVPPAAQARPMPTAASYPDHPLVSIVWKLLLGGLIVDAVGLVGLFLVGAVAASMHSGSSSNSLLFGLIPLAADCLIIAGSVWLVGKLFFGRSGWLDNKRWERYSVAQFFGFMMAAFLLSLILLSGVSGLSAGSLSQAFRSAPAVLILSGASLIAFVFGMFVVLTRSARDTAAARQRAEQESQAPVPPHAAAGARAARPLETSATAPSRPASDPARARTWVVVLLALVVLGAAFAIYWVNNGADDGSPGLFAPQAQDDQGSPQTSGSIPESIPSGCRAWSEISAADAGSTRCVYGEVRASYLGGSLTYITFTDDTRAFRLVDLQGRDFSQLAGQCVTATGVVKAYDQVAYIEVGDRLETCP